MNWELVVPESQPDPDLIYNIAVQKLKQGIYKQTYPTDDTI